MPLNLKSFREVTNGFARQCNFSIGFPDLRGKGLTGGILSKVVGTAASPLLNAFASSMEMPSKTITTSDITVQAGWPKIRLAQNVQYGDWTINFYSDELLMIRYYMLDWMEVVHNSKTHSMGLPSNYKSNHAYAAVLSPSHIPVQVFTFKGLFPTNVGAVQMSQQNSEILTFSVTFAYDYFTVNDFLSMLVAYGVETIGNNLLNSATGTSVSRDKFINAPLGQRVNIPF